MLQFPYSLLIWRDHGILDKHSSSYVGCFWYSKYFAKWLKFSGGNIISKDTEIVPEVIPNHDQKKIQPNKILVFISFDVETRGRNVE